VIEDMHADDWRTLHEFYDWIGERLPLPLPVLNEMANTIATLQLDTREVMVEALKTERLDEWMREAQDIEDEMREVRARMSK